MPSTPLRALPPESLRTLAFIGPAAAGKTTLVEALLHRGGAIGALGSIERGSTVSDFDPLEKKHEHSLHSALLHLHRTLPEGGEVRLHLIDTPGHPDFIGPALTALEAVETAVVVVSATNGIEPAARRLMQAAAARGLCRMIVVNKIDAQGLDLVGLMAQLRTAFGKECLPLNLPAGGGKEVVDCFFAPDAPPGHEADFSSVAQAHRALVEQVVEVDAAFVERYLEEGDVDAGELHAPLEQALREGHLIPVCFVSARNGAGLDQLLDVFARLMPNPTEGNPPAFLLGEGAAAKPIEVRPDPKAHVL
ncbi:MAG: elongation factor, partial [Pseudomonadota bacterium]